MKSLNKALTMFQINGRSKAVDRLAPLFLFLVAANSYAQDASAFKSMFVWGLNIFVTIALIVVGYHIVQHLMAMSKGMPDAKDKLVTSCVAFVLILGLFYGMNMFLNKAQSTFGNTDGSSVLPGR